MFKFRTLTICLKLRVVVTVLRVVFCSVLHLVTTSQGSFSVTAQDLSSYLQHYSPFSRWSKTWRTHGMENKIHKESTQRTKVAFGLFLPCIKKCMWNCNMFPSQPLLQNIVTLWEIIQNTVHHILFYFTWTAKWEGGEQKWEFTKSTLNMIFCGSTQKSERTVELHFFVVASMTAKQQLSSLPNFHKSSCPLQRVPGR